jgi:hypothetical protein
VRGQCFRILAVAVVLELGLQGARCEPAHAPSSETALQPCRQMLAQAYEEQESATLITAMFRGNSQGLKDILASAAADTAGACFVDVVLPWNGSPELLATAQALVSEAEASLQRSDLEASEQEGHAARRVFRVVDASEDDRFDTERRVASRGQQGLCEDVECVWRGYHVIMEDGIEYPEDYLDVARQVRRL